MSRTRSSHPQAGLGVPAKLVLGAACSVVLACAGGDDLSQRSKYSTGTTPSPLVFGSGTASSGGTNGEPEPPSETDLATVDPTSTEFEILIDPPRTVSIYCGDGVRDPLLEECDDGPGSGLDLCSPNCQTRDLLASPLAESGHNLTRRLGLGRHPLSLTRTGDSSGRTGVGALSYVESGAGPENGDASPRVVTWILDRQGNPTQRLVVADAGVDNPEEGNPTFAANPVSVALPDGSIAVFYNDLNGDGDELGVAARLLTEQGEGWALSGLSFANGETLGAQQDPDAIWTGAELVVAWLDTSNPETGPDIHFRTYGLGLGAGAGSAVLAATPNPEGSVALTPWSFADSSGLQKSWAAAWRESLADGSEAIVVFHDGVRVPVRPVLAEGTWDTLDSEGAPGTPGTTFVPFMPGHADDRPGIAPLDDTHVAVAFTVGTDPEGTGVASVFRLAVAVVDVTSAAVVELLPVEPLSPTTTGLPGDALRSMRQPTLVAATDPALGGVASGRVFLAWRSEGALGDSNGEDLWLKRLDWDGESLSLHPEVALPRTTEPGPQDHDPGDQRAPALASFPIPGGPGIGIAWEDHGGSFGAEQAQPDVVLQVAPVPLRRGPLLEKSCSTETCGVGEGPCSTIGDCASGLTCLEDRGPWYGYGAETDVCGPASCVNGVLDGDETGVDCGGSCGKCFQCLGSEYAGTAHYCSAVCACENLEGDCDSDLDCDFGLTCIEDSGELVSLPAPIDLCLAGHCVDGQLSADELREDCGGTECVPCDNGSEAYCVEQACLEGEGDCSTAGALCETDLVCAQDQESIYDLPEGVGVCVPAACAQDRGTPNSTGFCTTTCRCPDGVGLCTQGGECLSGICAKEVGIYFGLEADASVCMSDHCFNGRKDVGETQVDCGGTCGTECPACSVDPSFRSAEILSDWGEPTWDGQGTILPIATNTLSGTATHGASSLRMAHCNFKEVHSIPLDGSEFEIVGDELLVDIRFQVGSGGSTWDWIGNFGLELHSPILGLITLKPETSYSRTDANQWITLHIPISQAIQNAFLEGQPGMVFRLRTNRSCYIAGAGGGAVHVDNLRFGGEAVFRSDCEPVDDGAGGTGGSNGTGGSGGTGGTGGSGGSGGTGGSAGSGGGGGSGGTGGTGGQSPTQSEEIMSMDDPSDWSSPQTPLVSNPDATQGSGSIQVPTPYVQLVSDPFSATEVGISDRLLMDLKIPPAQSGQSLTGHLDVHLSCPSVGLFDDFIGDIGLWDKPTDTWFTGSVSVSQNIRNALATTAQDCSFRLIVSIANAASGVILLDNVRFAGPGVCTSYTQVPSPPFSLGMPAAPNGSAARPWPLCTSFQVQYLMDHPSLWDEHFELHSDLDLSGVNGRIGNESVPFTGTFDGNDHTLYDYQLAGADYAGLFGRVAGDGNLDGVADGYVGNLLLNGFTVSGGSWVGALAGDFNGYAENIHSVGATITGTGNGAGGLIGRQNGTFLNSSSDASVTLDGDDAVGGFAGQCFGTVYGVNTSGSVTLVDGVTDAGGLCGFADGLIQDCMASVSVDASATHVGGLVGRCNGDIVHSSAHGIVTQTNPTKTRVGGLVGIVASGGSISVSYADGDVFTVGEQAGGLAGHVRDASVLDSYATGDVEGIRYVGGLAGATSINNGPTSVTRAYSRGVVTGSYSIDVGALIGSKSNTTATSCFASSTENPSLPVVGGGSSAGTSLATGAQLTTQSIFTGWNFSTVWIMGPDGPELR